MGRHPATNRTLADPEQLCDLGLCFSFVQAFKGKATKVRLSVRHPWHRHESKRYIYCKKPATINLIIDSGPACGAFRWTFPDSPRKRGR